MVILYAEDDIDDFDVFCEVIHGFDSGIECINAMNGVEVLEFLENCDRLPDYIVIDINMPAMDGKACLKNIKKDPRFASIPVIVYSTSREPKDVEFCKELGAIDYLKKPNTMEEAAADLAKYFKRSAQN
jgi:CheY-like chemotaxis protein